VIIGDYAKALRCTLSKVESAPTNAYEWSLDAYNDFEALVIQGNRFVLDVGSTLICMYVAQFVLFLL